MVLTNEQLAELTRAAKDARSGSYSPYSKFPVGCAIMLADGEVFTGSNIENGAYPASLCAERSTISAVFSARPSNDREIVAVVVVGPDDVGDCAPCGSCRQWLHELTPDATIGFRWQGEIVTMPVAELLPFGFNLD